MSNLEIIKAKLEQINEARTKASKSWSVGFIQSNPDGPNTMRIDTDGVRPNLMPNDAKFVVMAANEITNLTKALSVAVTTLEFYDGVHRLSWAIDLNKLPKTADETLKAIAEILSGGGSVK